MESSHTGQVMYSGFLDTHEERGGGTGHLESQGTWKFWHVANEKIKYRMGAVAGSC